MKVLVVDDVGYTRLFLDRALTKQGHDVLTASSGAEALSALKANSNIEVVLADLMMRDMDGVALFQNAARLERLTDDGAADPPVFLLMTALRPGCNAQQRDIQRMNLARQLGFAEILYKPIEQEELLRVFDRIAGRKVAREIDIEKPADQFHKLVADLAAANNAVAAQQLLDRVVPDISRLREVAGTG